MAGVTRDALTRFAVLLALLLPGAAGCLKSTPEVRQLRALADDLQRKNVELALEKLRLEREVEKLRAENEAFRKKLGTPEKETP